MDIIIKLITVMTGDLERRWQEAVTVYLKMPLPILLKRLRTSKIPSRLPVVRGTYTA
jgi:hypothetical protein